MSNPRYLPVKSPEWWLMKRAKYLFRQTSKKGFPEEPVLSASQEYGVVPQAYLEELLDRHVMVATKGMENFKLVEPNNFVISLRSFEGGIEYSAHKGIISGAYTVMQPSEDVIPSFYRYYLKNLEFISRLQSVTTGIRDGKTVRYEDFSGLEIPIPKIDEQKAIANFLDSKVSKIDKLIKKKNQQIALLHEKRAAIISNSVIKGLNSNVKMKDSGIEWLGEIPNHWEVCLLKRVMNIAYGVGGELDRSLIHGTSILSLPNISIDGNLKFDDVAFVELTDLQKKQLILKKGDLLFNWRNGSSEHLGKTAYFDLDGEYTHVSFLLRLRCHQEKDDPLFFKYLLNGFQITGFFSSSKAGVNNTFNMNELSNLWVIVPPEEEQKAISSFLKKEILKIDSFIEVILKSVKLLQEYRTGLITAAVTGKIDVSKEAA